MLLLLAAAPVVPAADAKTAAAKTADTNAARAPFPLFVPSFQSTEVENEVQRKAAQCLIDAERDRTRRWILLGVFAAGAGVTLTLALREHRKSRAKPIARFLLRRHARRPS